MFYRHTEVKARGSLQAKVGSGPYGRPEDPSRSVPVLAGLRSSGAATESTDSGTVDLSRNVCSTTS